MAFPTVVSEISSENESADTTTPTASLPASLVSGNLIVLVTVVDGNAGTITDPSGFTPFSGFPVTDGINGVHIHAWWKISSGSEGASIGFTTAFQRSQHYAWQISGYDSLIAPQGSATGTTGTTSADPPTLTPTGGAKDYLWLAIGGKDRGAEAFTGFPANYTNTGESNMTAFDSGGVCIAWGRRELNAASEDPAAFTWTVTNRGSVAATLAVHPGSDGGAATSQPPGARFSGRVPGLRLQGGPSFIRGW